MDSKTEELLQRFLKAGIKYFDSFDREDLVDADDNVLPAALGTPVPRELIVDKLVEVVAPVEAPSPSVLAPELMTKGAVEEVESPAPPRAITQADLVKKSMDKLHLRLFQDRLVKIIDDNEAALAKSIEALGCGGDCYRCPMPEFDKIEDQVFNCLTAVVEGLHLDRALLE